MISNSFIQKHTSLIPPEDFVYDTLGLSNSNIPNTLSFFDDEKYLNQIVENKNITGVIVKNDFIPFFQNKKRVIVSEDPRWDYYTLYNAYSKNNFKITPNNIASSAIIHKTASIADSNITIGENTIIGPNVSILEDVQIGNNCVVKPGAVIGTDGFEHKKTSKGIISVHHDGKVIIGNNVEIGANTCVDKGFSFKNTVIEDNVRIDNLVYVAHCVTVKIGAFITGSATIGGSTEIGSNTWIALNGTLRDRISVGENAMVGLGAAVTKPVPKNETWIGNPAKKYERK
jgi:UDP-3-O-[3-hydroxymyristoyl] glucosamine N-acyltransferase